MTFDKTFTHVLGNPLDSRVDPERGYTTRYTVAVWTGDFEGDPMNQLSGTIGAGPLFNKIAHLVMKGGGMQSDPVEFEIK